jgi:hypothetical protein
MLTLLQRWMKALQRKTEQHPGSAWTRGARHREFDAYRTGGSKSYVAGDGRPSEGWVGNGSRWRR